MAKPDVHLPVRADWLALHHEPVLEPGLAIVDPHHHLWDRPGARYLLPELLEDTGSGHNIIATVFMQCQAMYRAVGPEAMKFGWQRLHAEYGKLLGTNPRE